MGNCCCISSTKSDEYIDITKEYFDGDEESCQNASVHVNCHPYIHMLAQQIALVAETNNIKDPTTPTQDNKLAFKLIDVRFKNMKNQTFDKKMKLWTSGDIKIFFNNTFTNDIIKNVNHECLSNVLKNMFFIELREFKIITVEPDCCVISVSYILLTDYDVLELTY